MLSIKPLIRNIFCQSVRKTQDYKFKFKVPDNHQTSNREEDLPPSILYLQKQISEQYWAQKFKQIEKPAQELIKNLLDPSVSKNKSLQYLIKYLEFRNLTFTAGVRSDLGCLAVLIAINQLRHMLNVDQYQSRITDFITLSDVQIKQIDGIMIHYLMISMNKRINACSQKNLRQYYKLKYIQITINNFDNILDPDLQILIDHINQSKIKENYNYVTKWRHFKLVFLVQNRISSLMKQYLEPNQSNKLILQITKKIRYVCLKKYINLLKDYQFANQEAAQTLFQYLIRLGSSHIQQFYYFKLLLDCIVNLPYIEIGPSKISLHKKLLGYFQERYQHSQTTRRHYSSLKFTYKQTLMQAILGTEFHVCFKNLPFEIVENFKILRKNNIQTPKVNEFVWVLFREDQRANLTRKIQSDIIYNLFKQKISKNNLQVRPNNIPYETSLQNETNIRIQSALLKLGYTIKKQQQICQRSVDLLINGQIILQIDGQAHYQYQTKQLSLSTSFRNLHLLLRGYKVVVISIYQYNLNRDIQNLQKLIKGKMEMVSRQGVVYVH